MDIVDTIPAKEFEVRLIGALLRRQSKIIFTTAVVVFGFAVAFLLNATPVYTATALILVDPDSQNILGPRNNRSGTSGRDNTRIDSEVEILRSDTIALSVIEQEKLTNDPEFGVGAGILGRISQAIGLVEPVSPDTSRTRAETLIKFRDATKIRRRGLTYLITVSAESVSPAQAANLANVLSATYISQQIQAKITRSLAAHDILRDQVIAAQISLASYETAFDQFIDKNLARMILTSASNPLVSLRSEIMQAQNNLQGKVQNQIDAKQLLQQENWTELGTVTGDSKLESLSLQRMVLVNSLSQQNSVPSAEGFHRALAAIDDKLNAQSVANLQAMSAQVQDIDQNISALRGQLRRAVLSSNLSPSLLTEIYTIQRQTSIARAQYDNLLSRQRDLETQARVQIADSQIVSPAIAPIEATFPNRNLVLLVALAASLGFGVSLAFLKEYYIGGVTSPLQLGELLASRNVVGIPCAVLQNSNQFGPADLIVDAPLSHYAESVRNLRAEIDQSLRPSFDRENPAVLSNGKIILVTSVMADEGKTTTALSLARTYAQAGVKTLLIDADLRRPSVHRQLGFWPESGFLDFLTSGPDVKMDGSCYAKDTASSLAVIMGAAPSENPTDQLISSAKFDRLIHQAKQVYEVVIIDTSPLLPVVDARYVAHHADAVALVVKFASTGQSDLKSATRTLHAAMKSSSPILPVLVQIEGQGGNPGYGDYHTSYSAAI